LLHLRVAGGFLSDHRDVAAPGDFMHDLAEINTDFRVQICVAQDFPCYDGVATAWRKD
jgi:hypothetical protein